MTDKRGLLRFLVSFEQPAVPDDEVVLDGEPRGPSVVGVTACDRDDALALVREQFWPDGGMPPVESIIEDVDVSTLRLDDHYLGVPVWRGVWYPTLAI